MSRKCAICGKKTMIGNNVSHANNKTKKKFNANLQQVKIVKEDGSVKKIKACTKCIKGNKTITDK